MAELKRILGQKHIIGHFENAIKMDKVSHAYIISGDAYFGKKHIANRYAMAINCEEHTGEPCMKCKSCMLAIADNHPDIITVTSEKDSKVIGVNEIREQVNNTVSIKPYYGRRKVYIIPNAQKMNTLAQNALLKTLEEPPGYVVIMLLTTNSASFLQTILSRSVVLDMRAVRESEIKEYLKSEYGIGDYDAGIAANFADGNPGKAAKAVTEEFIELRDQVIKSITTVANGDMRDVKLAVTEAKAYKSEKNDRKDMTEYFGLIRMWLRDMLVYKATKDKSRVIFKGELNNLVHMCETCNYENINNMLMKLDYVMGLIASNVNFDASIELLYIGFREEINQNTEY